MAKKRLIQAINDTLFAEMARDPKIILFGEDVEISMFGDTKGLHARFGPDRIRNTPICEATLTGMAVGAAAGGYRVILHMMFSNFIYTGFDAIANQMAKLRLMTGGQIKLPITVIASTGGGRATAAQHSDSPYPLLMNLGGVNVTVPSTPADAAGLMRTSIRGDNPTFYLEAGGRGGERGEVPDGDFTIPFGVARVCREGTDVTLVSIGAMMKPTLQAAATLAEAGIDAEVIDCRTLVPLDTATLIASVAKTGRIVIIDEARDRCSAASHIAAVISDEAFNHLKAPVKRVTVPNVAMPYAPNVEKSVIPDQERICAVTIALLQNNMSAP
ncbi:MAG: alpha-ketoacid dehydrogenase subunit beta [Gammaproteobacteria bacterium]|nr:alpha-ketoacid dehydrogenase subunit beta [Gammaproteobacteria bacterium]